MAAVCSHSPPAVEKIGCPWGSVTHRVMASGEVYLLVEAKGLVLVIHGDQDLGDGAAELGVHLPAQGGGDCAVHHRQQNRQQEGRSAGHTAR